jgi:CubicO group peptidase (beta-lactamase class C family)
VLRPAIVFSILLPTLLLLAAAHGADTSEKAYFPPPESKGGWRKLDNPDDIRSIAGMDPDKLKALKEWLLKSDNRNFAAVVVRRGHIVLEVERGNSAKTDSRRVASVSKAICATVLAIASEQSRHRKTPRKMTFDDPAFDYIPQARPLSDPRKAKITVKQLFNHTSGITPEATGAPNRGPWKHVLGHDGDRHTQKLAFDPGTNCGYSTFALYHAALVCENVTGKPYDRFAVEELFKPTGCEKWSFEQFDGGDPAYGRHPSHSMGMPARDLARIALCMLQGGRWNDRQIIPKWFVDETRRPTHSVEAPEMRFRIPAQCFSHGWELPARLTGENGTPSGKGIPDDARYKPGSGGQLIAFVPSLDLVVTRQTGSSGAWEYAEYLRRACAAVLPQTDQKQSGATHSSYTKWSRIELAFNGPNSDARGTPNPFAVAFDVVFSGPDGSRYRVPGFYDGDGKQGENGNVWKVRFSADKAGAWTHTTESSHSALSGKTGRFVVTDVPNDAQGFWKWGRLEYTGTPQNQIRYLKFRDGPYWLKAGCDDPENFLGKSPHFDTLAKRKAAVDYLAGRGINSLYIMTHNIDGDDKDVWPWLGNSANEAKSNGAKDVRFDISKLEEWRELFEHMQTRGVVPYLILEDDSAWKHYDHDRYDRELIARFGYLPAVVFNLGEEHNENYSLRDSLARAKRFKTLDPYRHPLGIHNVNQPNDAYVDSPDLDLTAIQTGQPGRASKLEFALAHNQIAVAWIERCRSRGRRVLVANFDEGRPELDRRAWWSAYLGGGVWEAHVPAPYDRPLASCETTWTELGGTRAFMESVPFHEMQPRNDLVVKGQAFCLARPPAVYAFYVPRGGSVSVHLAPDQRYTCDWWNPANGKDGQFTAAQQTAGGQQTLTPPGDGDWALRIRLSKSIHFKRGQQESSTPRQ